MDWVRPAFSPLIVNIQQTIVVNVHKDFVAVMHNNFFCGKTDKVKTYWGIQLNLPHLKQLLR
jgi:hypothetical protein